MTRTLSLILLAIVAYYGQVVAQETCEAVALADINAALADLSTDIGALFAEFEAIEESFNECEQPVPQAELSPSDVIDGGLIREGLWTFGLEYVYSDACDERTKRETLEFYEDVYYNDEGLLIWDAGNRYSNYTFEYLTARRYTRSEGNSANWVYEYRITSATETTISGDYAGYWQGNRDVWCTFLGTFTAELFDTDNSCLVEGEANIRSNPSTKSPKNGSIEEQRRVADKVEGDDGYFWWKLSDDEYVREDVVGASRSCERL